MMSEATALGLMLAGAFGLGYLIGIHFGYARGQLDRIREELKL